MGLTLSPLNQVDHLTNNYTAFQSIKDQVLSFIDRSICLRLEKEDIVAVHELKKDEMTQFHH